MSASLGRVDDLVRIATHLHSHLIKILCNVIDGKALGGTFRTANMYILCFSEVLFAMRSHSGNKNRYSR